MTPAPARLVRTTWIAVGSLAAVVGLFVAGTSVASAFARDTETTRQVVEDRVAALEVDGHHNVSVRIVGSDRDDVVIEAVAHRGLLTPDQDVEVEGDRLHVSSSCGPFSPFAVGLFCGTEYTISVPADLDVEVDGAGGVTIVDVAGRVDVSATGGSVTLDGTSGPVEVHAGGGSVDGVGLRTPAVDASADGGSLDLAFAVPPRRLDLSSDGGSVVVELPDEPVVYRVDASADGGSVDTQIRTDPEADRTIAAHSDGGSVVLRYRGAG